MNRREVLIGTAAALCASAIPALAIQPAASAGMLFTVDEPWGAYVLGHVRQPEFAAAVTRMITDDSDLRDDGEDWLFTENYDDEHDVVSYEISEGAHSYMREAGNHPELSLTYRRCAADAPGAFPVTVVKY